MSSPKSEPVFRNVLSALRAIERSTRYIRQHYQWDEHLMPSISRIEMCADRAITRITEHLKSS